MVITHWNKPSPGTPFIRTGHPHTQGLIFAAPLLDVSSGFDSLSAGGLNSIVNTTLDVGPNRRVGLFVPGSGGIRSVIAGQGLGLRGHLSSSEWVDFGSSSFLPTQEFSFVLGYHRTEPSLNTYPGAFGINGSTEANNCGAHVLMGDGSTYWDFGGNTSGTNRLIVTNPAAPFDITGPHLWVFTTGPRGMEVWVDGNLIGSNTSNPTRTPNSAVDFGLFMHRAQFADNAVIYCGYGYDRQLDPQTIQSLVGDPYAMFRRPGHLRAGRFFSSTSVAGSGGVTFGGPALAGTAFEIASGVGGVSFGAPALAGTGVEGFSASGGVSFGGPVMAGVGFEIAPYAVSQLAVELSSVGTHAQQVSQLAVELGNRGTKAQQISQLTTELASTGQREQRLSALAVELANRGTARQQVSQLVVEFAVTGHVSTSRLSQLVMELAYPNIDVAPPPPPPVVPRTDDCCSTYFGDSTCVDDEETHVEVFGDAPLVTANNNPMECFSDVCDTLANGAGPQCFGD